MITYILPSGPLNLGWCVERVNAIPIRMFHSLKVPYLKLYLGSRWWWREAVKCWKSVTGKGELCTRTEVNASLPDFCVWHQYKMMSHKVMGGTPLTAAQHTQNSLSDNCTRSHKSWQNEVNGLIAWHTCIATEILFGLVEEPTASST